MSEAAAAIETPAAPAPSAPSGVPAPAGGGAGSGGGGTSAQPSPSAPSRGEEKPGQPSTPQAGGSTQAGPEGAKPPEEPHVPWRKFREVQTEATRARQAHQGEMARVQAQISHQQQQLTELSRVKDDFSTLEQLLEDNPDLAEQLFQRAGQGRRQAGGGHAPARAAQEDAATREIRELRAMIQQDREAQQRQLMSAQEQAATQRTDQELTAQLKGLLSQHDLDEGWLPHARAYVLDYARRVPNLDMTEVPYVFAEWARPMHGLLVNQLDKWRSGKMADQRTMPAAPNGNGAVMANPGSGFGPNDRRTAQFLEEQLKARLGWRNE